MHKLLQVLEYDSTETQNSQCPDFEREILISKYSWMIQSTCLCLCCLQPAVCCLNNAAYFHIYQFTIHRQSEAECFTPWHMISILKSQTAAALLIKVSWNENVERSFHLKCVQGNVHLIVDTVSLDNNDTRIIRELIIASCSPTLTMYILYKIPTPGPGPGPRCGAQHKTKQIYHLLSPPEHTAASTNLRREVVMVILVLVSIDWLELLFLLTIQ